MIRRILAIVLIALGLGTVGAAIASATAWKPDETATVPLPAQPSTNFVVSEPGVLNIVNETVRVRVVAQDSESPVFLAMGRTRDVEAWVSPSDHGRITGLESWDALTYEQVDADLPDEQDEEQEGEGDDDEDSDGEESPTANPATSDMWVETVNGVGELTYTWEEIPGQWSMIVATDGSTSAPMVELTWEREVPTPALIPGIAIGAVVTIAGAILLTFDLLRRRAQRLAAKGPGTTVDSGADPLGAGTDEPSTDEPSPEEIMAGVEAAALDVPPLSGDEDDYADVADQAPDEEYPHQLQPMRAGDPERPLTRREIRERERARERAAALGGETDPGEPPAEAAHWPTQDASASQDPSPAHGSEAGGDPAPRPRWWKRKPKRKSPPAPGPMVVDENTGEIIITGEIDVSRVTPSATASSWRATWGLDGDTQTRWVPTTTLPEEDMTPAPSHEGSDDEQ